MHPKISTPHHGPKLERRPRRPALLRGGSGAPRRRVHSHKNAKELATQMTETLDKLVGVNYDSRIRPNYGGKPVQVELNMAVTGMVNTTFQIHWIDKIRFLHSNN